MKFPWRKNVLTLVITAYVVLVVLFSLMMWPGDLTAKDAYDVLEGPFMALIGGSLALSKDLLDNNTSERVDENSNKQQIEGQDETAADEHQ